MLGAVRDADPSLTRQAVASLLRTWFCSTAGQQMRMTGVRPAPPVGIALRESNDHSLGPVLSACWEDDAIMVRWLLSFSCGGAPDSPFGRELQVGTEASGPVWALHQHQIFCRVGIPPAPVCTVSRRLYYHRAVIGQHSYSP